MNTNQAYAHCFIANQNDVLCGYFLSPSTPIEGSISAFCYDQQNSKVFAVVKCRVIPCKSKEAEKTLRKALNIFLLNRLDKEDPNKKIGAFCKETIESFKNAMGYNRPNVKSLVIVEKFELGDVNMQWKFPNPTPGKHYFVTVSPKANEILTEF